MNFEYTNFFQSNIDKFFGGAGVIFYARSVSGTRYFLLGRERFSPWWRGSCQWSGFEGSRKNGENVNETAVRECYEESLGVIMNLDDVNSCIQAMKYILKIVISVKTPNKPPQYHVTFIVPIKLDTSASSKFCRLRNNMEEIERISQRFLRMFPFFLLKSGVITDVGDIRTQGNFLVVRCFTRQVNENDAWTRETFLNFVSKKGGRQVPSPLPDTTVKLICNNNGERVEDVYVPNDSCCAITMNAFESARVRLEKLRMCHPSVTAVMGVRSGRLQHIVVNSDFMEKDRIRWWSESELHAALNNFGIFESEIFRPYFIPVVQAILENIDSVT